MFRTGLLGVLVLFFLFQLECALMKETRRAGESRVAIVPQPAALKEKTGSFQLDRTVVLVAEGEAASVAEFFREAVRRSSGVVLEMHSGKISTQGRQIVLGLTPDKKLGREGYRLRITRNRVEAMAAQPAGLFYAVQSLLQLCPPEVYSPEPRLSLPVQIPCVEILDRPRFPWRGMLLDVSRHFMPKEFIFRCLDFLAMHKMNVFHWHLNDDQGWRLEIKRYPQLTRISAWRVDREQFHWNAREPQKPGEEATYGGFYTQEDIREIVAYAQERFITIVPEIEMPGHCLAVLAAFPELSCTGGPFTVPPGGVWPIKDVYCAGNDSVFTFLENVLTEVMALFPGKYIHIGGDEVNKQEWKKCPKCQARMQAEGLATEEELQSYFIRRIERFLNRHGRQIIGWDEILEGGLAPNAAVMSWRGMEGGLAAASQNHDVVMTPTSHCYFDYYQGNPQQEPLAIGGYLPLRRVYSFEPIPEELAPDKRKHILGVQANLWTEYVPNPDHACYMLFPRLAAMAEVGWSPRETRNWPDFGRRLLVQLRRYEAAEINYARSAFAVSVSPQQDEESGQFGLALTTELPGCVIRYTTDGSEPGLASPEYTRPLRPTGSLVLQARAYFENKPAGPVTTTDVRVHKAFGKPVTLEFPYKERYAAGGQFALTNGLLGSNNFRDGRWQGFQGDDLVATVDLGQETEVQAVSASFLQNLGSWIFLPVEVEMALSRDGQEFEPVKTISLKEEPRENLIRLFSAEFSPRPARFVRVRAKNRGVCPEWHAGAGEKAWLFIDEIVVE